MSDTVMIEFTVAEGKTVAAALALACLTLSLNKGSAPTEAVEATMSREINDFSDVLEKINDKLDEIA